LGLDDYKVSSEEFINSVRYLITNFELVKYSFLDVLERIYPNEKLHGLQNRQITIKDYLKRHDLDKIFETVKVSIKEELSDAEIKQIFELFKELKLQMKKKIFSSEESIDDRNYGLALTFIAGFSNLLELSKRDA
jgi:hypothetical protein